MAAFSSPMSFFNFGVMGRRRGGDFGEGALNDLVPVRHGGRNVVKVGIEVFGEAGAVGEAGDGPARARGDVKGDVVDGLGRGYAEGVFATRYAHLAFEVFMEG